MAASNRWRGRTALTVGSILIGIGGCSAPLTPPPGGGAKPVPPPARLFTPVTTTLDFSGSQPPPFEDPSTEDERRSGRWSMGRWLPMDNSYRQTVEAPTATLMFRRYNGDAFGMPNGYAPSKYRVEVTVQAYKPTVHKESELAGAPVGVLAVVPYYLDSKDYIIVEAVKNRYEAWFVQNLTPGDEWNADVYRKFQIQASPDIKVGEPVKFGTEIDTKQGSMKLYINDELKEIISDPGFIKDVQKSVALVSNGNFVSYSDVKLTPLSAE